MQKSKDEIRKEKNRLSANLSYQKKKREREDLENVRKLEMMNMENVKHFKKCEKNWRFKRLWNHWKTRGWEELVFYTKTGTNIMAKNYREKRKETNEESKIGDMW